MKKQYFSLERDGFYGVYYPNPSPSKKAFIAMLGDRMAVSGVKWLHQNGCNVMTISPDKKDHRQSCYPLERIGRAIESLKARGNRVIGFVGASTFGMVSLSAASYFSEITLTIALTPPDFVMEGVYQDKKDGTRERPSESSSLSWQGRPLPYLPYAYRHPQYWRQVIADSKASGNLIASRLMFEESERLHPVREEEKIKVENIKGRLIFVGAEDDVMWDTCKYIRRMMERLDTLPHDCAVETLLYEHGTHFVFPQPMLKAMLPIGSGLLIRLMFKTGRQHPKECRQTRLDIDRRLSQAIAEWGKEG